MVDESKQKLINSSVNGIELIQSIRLILENANIEIPDEIYEYLDELTPADVGRESFEGGWVLRFEGFSDECISDVEYRLNLPKSDPKFLSQFDDVFTEVLTQWKEEESLEPLDWGFVGDEDYPIQYAIFYKGN